MSEERMYRKLREEIGGGWLARTDISGRRERRGGVEMDFYIVGFEGRNCGYYHPYILQGNTYERSVRRLKRAVALLPPTTDMDIGRIFQAVYDSGRAIVAAVVAGLNPGGDEFSFLLHHADLTEAEAGAVIHGTFAIYLSASRLSN